MSTPPQDAQQPDPQLPSAAWQGYAVRHRTEIRELEDQISTESADRIRRLIDSGVHLGMSPPEYLPLLIEALDNVRHFVFDAIHLIDAAVEREPRVEQSLLGVAGRCPDLMAHVIARDRVISRVISNARDLVVGAHPWLSDLAAKYLGAKSHEWTGGFALFFEEITGLQLVCMLTGHLCDLNVEITKRRERLNLIRELAERDEFGAQHTPDRGQAVPTPSTAAKTPSAPTGKKKLTTTQTEVYEAMKDIGLPATAPEIASKVGGDKTAAAVRQTMIGLKNKGIVKRTDEDDAYMLVEGYEV